MNRKRSQNGLILAALCAAFCGFAGYLLLAVRLLQGPVSSHLVPSLAAGLCVGFGSVCASRLAAKGQVPNFLESMIFAASPPLLALAIIFFPGLNSAAEPQAEAQEHVLAPAAEALGQGVAAFATLWLGGLLVGLVAGTLVVRRQSSSDGGRLLRGLGAMVSWTLASGIATYVFYGFAG